MILMIIIMIISMNTIQDKTITMRIKDRSDLFYRTIMGFKAILSVYSSL